MDDYLGNAYPLLKLALPKRTIATLPTPISCHNVVRRSRQRTVWVKHDDQSNPLYGGNKVRKLEYLLQRAKDRNAKRVATFGAVGSHHALATALFAAQAGLPCTCFLAHQKSSKEIANTLAEHLALGTEIVRYGGAVNQLQLFRRYLQHRGTWVIPLGGSSWLGAIGFVNAGLELASQIAAGELPVPDRIYIANGTMGSVAGLAIGLALADLPTKIHAVRVADNAFTHIDVLTRLMRKAVSLLHRIDASIAIDTAERTRIRWRNAFYAGGYAHIDDATRDAIDTAAAQLGLQLEGTYTGKAMAALLHDLPSFNGTSLFWNTYSPATPSADVQVSRDSLPEEFHRYLE